MIFLKLWVLFDCLEQHIWEKLTCKKLALWCIKQLTHATHLARLTPLAPFIYTIHVPYCTLQCTTQKWITYKFGLLMIYWVQKIFLGVCEYNCIANFFEITFMLLPHQTMHTSVFTPLTLPHVYEKCALKINYLELTAWCTTRWRQQHQEAREWLSQMENVPVHHQ